MPELTAFSSWESFYVIVGSSAAALTGLQFVVIALIADAPMKRSLNEINTFGTPTVVHFGAVLLMSALLSAPWHRLSTAGVILGAMGAGGVVYELVVLSRTRRTGYRPVMEDWIWHVILPVLAYLGIFGAAIALPTRPEPALFAVAAASLALLFIGIHNAWDTVTYIAVTRDKSTE